MSVGGSMTHIKTITVSSPTDNVQFVHVSSVVLDSTYKEYIFYLVDMHHNSNSEPEITFNFSIDSTSNYNVTKTSTSFRSYHGKIVVECIRILCTNGCRSTSHCKYTSYLLMLIETMIQRWELIYDYLIPVAPPLWNILLIKSNEVHDLPRSNGNYFWLNLL